MRFVSVHKAVLSLLTAEGCFLLSQLSAQGGRIGARRIYPPPGGCKTAVPFLLYHGLRRLSLG